MLWVPAGSELVVQVATPLVTGTVARLVEAPVLTLYSWKVTAPVGAGLPGHRGGDGIGEGHRLAGYGWVRGHGQVLGGRLPGRPRQGDRAVAVAGSDGDGSRADGRKGGASGCAAAAPAAGLASAAAVTAADGAIPASAAAPAAATVGVDGRAPAPGAVGVGPVARPAGSRPRPGAAAPAADLAAAAAVTPGVSGDEAAAPAAAAPAGNGGVVGRRVDPDLGGAASPPAIVGDERIAAVTAGSTVQAVGTRTAVVAGASHVDAQGLTRVDGNRLGHLGGVAAGAAAGPVDALTGLAGAADGLDVHRVHVGGPVQDCSEPF